MTNTERDSRICLNCPYGRSWLSKYMSFPRDEFSKAAIIYQRLLETPPAEVKAEMCDGLDKMKCQQTEGDILPKVVETQ